jgi:hypothetical protein
MHILLRVSGLQSHICNFRKAEYPVS